MYTGCTIWQNQVKPQHICPYTSAPTFDIQQVHSTNLQSSHLANASTPIPRCVVGECALLIPLSQLSQKGRLVEWCRGGRGGVWQSLPPPPGGRQWRINKTQIQSCRSRQELSTVRGQLGLNVHSADGAFPAGGQPLVHTPLVEEVHAG